MLPAALRLCLLVILGESGAAAAGGPHRIAVGSGDDAGWLGSPSCCGGLAGAPSDAGSALGYLVSSGAAGLKDF